MQVALQLRVISTWLSVCALAAPAAPRIWFVRSSAIGSNNGGSWPNAFSDLQDALAIAQSGDEIWVAAGIYTPDRGTGDRLMSFDIGCGVAMYGGFGGWEECRDERDWHLHETILSGDLNGDDGPRDCAKFSNCCYAHEGIGCDDAACQELYCSRQPSYHPCCGFGSPNPGWSESCARSAQRLCCEIGNWNACENAVEVVRVTDCSELTTLDGFTIEKAYYDYRRDPQYVGLVYGAGLRVVRSNVFAGNITARENTSEADFMVNESRLTLDHCWMGGGSGGVEGGGEVVANDCIFDDSHANVYGNVTYRRCLFKNRGRSLPPFSSNAGINCNAGHTTIEDCSITGGTSYGIYAQGSFSMLRSTVADNLGLAISAFGGTIRILRSRITGNGYNFRALYAAVQMEDTLYSDNGALIGAAIEIQNGSLDIRRSTIARNISSDGFAGAIRAEASSAPTSISVSDSIIWAGEGVVLPSYGLVQARGLNESAIVNHSIVQGWTGELGGDGNSGSDPLFVDPLGTDGLPGTDDDDWRLAPGSPAINAGNPNYFPATGAADLDGHPRVLCGQVDIGAYEFGIGDFNCDQKVDLSDFTLWPACMTNPRPSFVPTGCEAFDFNNDSDIDLADFAEFQNLFNGSHP